jgi:hypothetical protein
MIRWFLLAEQFAALGAASAQDCEVCHPRQAEAATSSPMTHALQRSGESDILKNNPDVSFRREISHIRSAVKTIRASTP